LLLQRQISNQLLQPGVLILQLLQASGLANVRATVFLSVPVVALFGYPSFFAGSRNTPALTLHHLDLTPGLEKAGQVISVYISRATQKLYVRRNTHKPWPDGGEVFDASIEVPVTLRTAMAHDGAGLRWTVVTIDAGDNAKEALDRITIPQDVLDRIAPTAVPRSSIIVSDEPLSKETNYRTEFVAVLSNQPQGGFITRQVTPPDAYASDGDGWRDDGFPFFRRSWNSQTRWRDDYRPVPRSWWR